MNTQKDYKLALALLRFKTAYKELVEASEGVPDYDISQAYPFYLLDFQTIAPAVLQWCNIHATKLMQNMPDKVDNPGCVNCSFFRAGLSSSGLCKGSVTTGCNLYPCIIFSKNAVLPFFTASKVDIQNLTDTETQLLYLKKVDELYEAKKIAAGNYSKHDTDRYDM